MNSLKIMEQIELKFKGWDKVKKRMYLWEHFNGIGHFFGDTSPVTDYGDDRISEDFIVLRYTGLKDKNEKEIYEGDIFILNKSDDEWYDSVIWDSVHARYELSNYRNPASDISLIDASRSNNFTIIGNVFENSELVK